MSELAISVVDAVKSFRRFNHPGWRAMDALGIPVSSKRYDVFSALRGLSLDVKQGEKVALIGRNGAGKSTLLRVISGQMKLDSGNINVSGTVQALMELGTGFHPDFTGLDNIRSSLAYQGLSNQKVNSLIDEIIDFTELDDFIGRPVREYSAGMYARLAFAVATTITPEILIIDEILGAGDAYFVGKSIQRMRQLTTQGATILFVSHDMSAVQMLCDRGVWIDKGRIKADGPILKISKAYLASVREDEEARARARSMQLSKRQILSHVGRNDIALYRFIGAAGQAPGSPFAIAGIKFGSGQHSGFDVSIGEEQAVSRLIIESGITNWSNATNMDGKNARAFGDFGGKFIHAPFQIDWSGLGKNDRWLELEYAPSVSDKIVLEFYDKESKSYKSLHEFFPENNGWKQARISLPNDDTDETATGCIEDLEHVELQVLASEDRYGDGPIGITAFGFFDEENTRRHTLISGEPARAILAYNVEQPVTDPVAVVAIYRPDGACALQVTSNRDGKKLGVLREPGKISILFDPLYLGPGDYVVSIALFKELNIASNHEPDAYDLHDRCYALKILPPEGVGVSVGIVNQPAVWELAQ